MTALALPDLRSRTRSLGDAVIEIMWLSGKPAAVLAGGSVCFDAVEDPQIASPTTSATISACRGPDRVSVILGKDDGRVCRVRSSTEWAPLDAPTRGWVNALASSPASGVIVAAVGRSVKVWLSGADSPSHSLAFSSTIEDLSLDAKGKRLAVTHYNGVTMLYPLMRAGPRSVLQWPGSHLACTLAPAADYVVTALQETGLHGWQLPSREQFSMNGYPAKTRSFSWSARGRWLATGGSASAVVWPFTGKTGPRDKSPIILGGRTNSIVTRVAFHPERELLAIGHSCGHVALGTLAGQEDALDVHKFDGSIIALSWSDDGGALAFADDRGDVGVAAFRRGGS